MQNIGVGTYGKQEQEQEEYTTDDTTNLGKNQKMKRSWRKSDLVKIHEKKINVTVTPVLERLN